MTIQLRPYQIKDVEKMVRRKRILNANEPGLGKTLETLYTRNILNCKSVLIISPKIATGVWENECIKWFNWSSTILEGTKLQRKKILDNFNTDILITNFALLAEVLEFRAKWDMIIIDEAHLGGLLNHKSKTYKLVKTFDSESLIILTGTPVRKGPQDLYSLLSLLWPKKFKSYWQFVNRYCIVNDTPFGKEILGRPKHPLEFNSMLSNYLVRNNKKDVLDELPDKIRSIVPIKMTKKQKKYYTELSNNMMVQTDEQFVINQNAMLNVLRLRQLLVCPKILGIDDYGGSIESLVTYLIPNEFDNDRSVVICTPFKKAIPFLKEYLNKHIPDVTIFEIHSDVKESAFEVSNAFQKLQKVTKVLIFTIKSGASWTATSASTCFFLGAEWSNIDNLQSEDRIHRLSQTNLVRIEYLLNSNSIDDAIKHRLEDRDLSSKWILDTKQIYNNLNKYR